MADSELRADPGESADTARATIDNDILVWPSHTSHVTHRRRNRLRERQREEKQRAGKPLADSELREETLVSQQRRVLLLLTHTVSDMFV